MLVSLRIIIIIALHYLSIKLPVSVHFCRTYFQIQTLVITLTYVFTTCHRSSHRNSTRQSSRTPRVTRPYTIGIRFDFPLPSTIPNKAPTSTSQYGLSPLRRKFAFVFRSFRFSELNVPGRFCASCFRGVEKP